MLHKLGLSQSEIAGNEKHYHNNTNDVKNIAHVSFSFLSRDRITFEPDARNITEREAGERGRLSHRQMKLIGISSSTILFGSGSCIPSMRSNLFCNSKRNIVFRCP